MPPTSGGQNSGTLRIPEITPEMDTLGAALAYAACGWYVLPVSPQDKKNPGSVVGKGWPAKSSRDPETITWWFTGSDHLLALHVGRSGAIAFDIDHPKAVPDVLAEAIQQTRPPYQSTRENQPGRGHTVFACPPERMFGNRLGDLGDGWGEVRGRNGVIIVAPSEHENAAEGARYLWQRTGVCPVLPDALAALLPDHTSTDDAATNAEVTEFLQAHTQTRLPGLLADVVDKLAKQIRRPGVSRHEATVKRTGLAMRDAARGNYPATDAAARLREVFVEAMHDPTLGSGRALSDRQAKAEFGGILAWAVGQIRANSPSPQPPPDGDQGEALAEGDQEQRQDQDDDPVDVQMGPQARTSRGGRPELHVGSPAICAEWLRVNVGTGQLAGMFNRSGEIVHTPREGEEGYVPLTDDDTADGPAQVRQVTAASLAARIQYTYYCFREEEDDDGKKKRKAAMFPTAAARVPVEVPDMLPKLRRLRGVAHSPIVRADGSILREPGYDAATHLYHLPEPGLEVPAVPEHPTDQQVADAVALLDKMTAEFKFVTTSDRANYYGLLLTPLLREILGPPYKLGCIGAPQPGSGKSLLAAVLRIVHGGVFRSEVPEDEAEMRKQITAILDVTTGPVVHFDNVSGVLRSSTLSGLLTSPVWDDRRLGSTAMVHRPNDRLWVITGNNLSLGGDLVRRALWVTIDPGIPDPHLRTGFAIENLEDWVRERRGELICALLTLVRAWVAAGRPTKPRAGDGFARWVEAVDGILSNAGVEGTFDAPESARQTVGTDDDDWSDFLAAVYAEFKDGTWTVKDLLGKVNVLDLGGGQWGQSRPIPVDALPSELAERVVRASNATIVGKSLGRWLTNRAGRWAGGLAVRQAGDDRTGVKVWTIEAADPARLQTTGNSESSEGDGNSAGFAGFAGFGNDADYGEPPPRQCLTEFPGAVSREWAGEKPCKPCKPCSARLRHLRRVNRRGLGTPPAGCGRAGVALPNVPGSPLSGLRQARPRRRQLSRAVRLRERSSAVIPDDCELQAILQSYPQ